MTKTKSTSSGVQEVRFTADFLDDLPTPAKGRDFYKDSHPKSNGLRLSVSHTGRKSFYVHVTVNGLTKKPRVGSYPALPIAEARKMALSPLNKAAHGIDPVEEKRAERAARLVSELTVKDAVEDYCKEKRTGRQKLLLKDSTRAEYKKKIKFLLGDDWESPLASIDEDLLTRKLKKVTTSQGASGCRSLSAVWNWTRKRKNNRGLIPPNPVKLYSDANEGLPVPQPRKGYIQEAYLADWFDAVESLPAPNAEFFIFLLLTGVRLQEARGLDWQDIDFKSGLYTLPDPKNRELVKLPLPGSLRGRLAKRRQKSGRVFPVGAKGCKSFGESIGFSFTHHDLRRTFTTYGFQVCDYVKVKLMANHILSGVTADYIQVSHEALSREHQKVEAHILRLAGRSISNVVPLTQVAG